MEQAMKDHEHTWRQPLRPPTNADRWTQAKMYQSAVSHAPVDEDQSTCKRLKSFMIDEILARPDMCGPNEHQAQVSQVSSDPLLIHRHADASPAMVSANCKTIDSDEVEIDVLNTSQDNTKFNRLLIQSRHWLHNHRTDQGDDQGKVSNQPSSQLARSCTCSVSSAATNCSHSTSLTDLNSSTNDAPSEVMDSPFVMDAPVGPEVIKTSTGVTGQDLIMLGNRPALCSLPSVYTHLHNSFEQKLIHSVINWWTNNSSDPHQQMFSRQFLISRKLQSQAKPRKGGQIRFKQKQTAELEQLFDKQNYLMSSERKSVANKLGLTERQVKTWFQNRRAKKRKMKPGPK